eukprot:1161729-Pelagomonas_calceolata.AAC.6
MAKSEAETGKHAQTHNHRSNVCLSKGPRTRRLCMYLTPSLTLDQGCPLPAKAFRQLFCGHWMEFSEETGMCLRECLGLTGQGTCCSAGALLWPWANDQAGSAGSRVDSGLDVDVKAVTTDSKHHLIHLPDLCVGCWSRE